MTRGPDKKQIEKETLVEVVEQVQPAGVEQIKETYNKKAEGTFSWNTCKDRLKMNNEFETIDAGGFTFWQLK